MKRAQVNINSGEIFIGVKVIGSSSETDKVNDFLMMGKQSLSIVCITTKFQSNYSMIVIYIFSGGPACIYHVIQLKYHFVFLDDTCALTRKGRRSRQQIK